MGIITDFGLLNCVKMYYKDGELLKKTIEENDIGFDEEGKPNFTDKPGIFNTDYNNEVGNLDNLELGDKEKFKRADLFITELNDGNIYEICKDCKRVKIDQNGILSVNDKEIANLPELFQDDFELIIKSYKNNNSIIKRFADAITTDKFSDDSGNNVLVLNKNTIIYNPLIILGKGYFDVYGCYHCHQKFSDCSCTNELIVVILKDIERKISDLIYEEIKDCNSFYFEFYHDI